MKASLSNKLFKVAHHLELPRSIDVNTIVNISQRRTRYLLVSCFMGDVECRLKTLVMI